MQFFAILTALFTSFVALNPRDGVAHALVWIPKVIASALSPLLAVINLLHLLAGWNRRDRWRITAGLLGTVIALRHISKEIWPNVFTSGDLVGDWNGRIPDKIRPRLSRRRWQPINYKLLRGDLYANIIYGHNPDNAYPLMADLLQPPADIAATGLAMIYVHGGAWRYGRRNIHKFPYFRHLANQGHVVMDIDYTLSPHTTVEGMVMDVKRAILWLKANAERFGVDPDRIVLAGQSAGGHLSLLAAYTPNDPTLQPPENDSDSSVCAVISYYGPTNLASLYNDMEARFGRVMAGQIARNLQRLLARTGNQVDNLNGLAAILGQSPEEAPDLYRRLSPVTYAHADCPPTLLLHGADDFLVPPQQAQELYEALQKKKAAVAYILFPHADHSFDSAAPKLSPASQTAAYYTERFLARLLAE